MASGDLSSTPTSVRSQDTPESFQRDISGEQWDDFLAPVFDFFDPNGGAPQLVTSGNSYQFIVTGIPMPLIGRLEGWAKCHIESDTTADSAGAILGAEFSSPNDPAPGSFSTINGPWKVPILAGTHAIDLNGFRCQSLLAGLYDFYIDVQNGGAADIEVSLCYAKIRRCTYKAV